ncbi:MAG: hypothetical protein ACREV5_04155 [Steroidobacter sp.]
MRFENQAFQNEQITLDDNEFVNCTFTKCKFHYSGGEFNIDRIRFDSLEFTVQGPAARTVMLLRSLWADEVGQRVVQGLLDPSKAGAPPE